MRIDFDPHLADVQDFHEKFHLTEGQVTLPKWPAPEILAMRVNFLQEEVSEYAKACGFKPVIENPKDAEPKIKWVRNPSIEPDHEEALDALVDTEYVLKGNVLVHGYDQPVSLAWWRTPAALFEHAWARVHTANMAKIRTRNASDSKRGSSFDVVKPKGWLKPTFADLISKLTRRNYGLKDIKK